MTRLAALALLGSVFFAGSAEARPCRPGETPRFSAAGSRSCDPGEKLKPYDPDAVRAGTRPGFIDLGDGTEIRIEGRARMDYDAGRR